MGQLSLFDIVGQEAEVEGTDTPGAPVAESRVVSHSVTRPEPQSVCHSDTWDTVPEGVIDLEAIPEVRGLRKEKLASEYESHEARQKEENAIEVERASFWGFRESDASVKSGWYHFRMVEYELEFKAKKSVSWCKLEIGEAPDGWSVGMWVPGHCGGPSIWDRYKYRTREAAILYGLKMIRDILVAKLKAKDYGGGLTTERELKSYLEQVKKQLLLVERGVYPEMKLVELNRSSFKLNDRDEGCGMRDWKQIRAEQTETVSENETVVSENNTIEKWGDLQGWLYVYDGLKELSESDEQAATIRGHIKSLTKEAVRECQDENLLQKVADILKQHKSEPKTEPKEDVSEPVQEVRTYNFIEGDRKHNNETVLRMIEDGSVDSEKAIRYFTGWGGLIKATQDQIQELGYTASNILAGGQYLTPLWVSEMITKLLPNDFLNGNYRVFDPTCGSGSLLWHFPVNFHKHGIEIEDTAIRVAKAVMPGANLIQDDVLYHVEDVENRMDVVVTNPPFGLHWRAEDETILERSGYEGRVLSHLATMEIAVRSLRQGGILFAVLPQGALDREDMIHFRRWIRNSCTEVGVIDLPKETFKANGTEAKTFVWILLKDWDWQMSRADQFFHQIVWDGKSGKVNQGHEAVERFRQSEWWEFLEKRFARYVPVEGRFEIKKYDPNPQIPIEPWTKTLPETDVDVVELKLGQYEIVMKPKGLIAALKVEELKNVVLGPSWSYSAQDYEYAYRELANLKNFYTEMRDVRSSDLVWYLKAMGLRVKIDAQLMNWIQNKRKWYKRMQTPYEIFEGDPYDHIDENDVFGTVKEGDHVQALSNVHADYYSYRYRDGNYYQVLTVEGDGEDRKVVMASESEDETFEFCFQQSTEFRFKRWGNKTESETFEFNALFGKVDMGFSTDQSGVMTEYRSEYRKWLKKFDDYPQFDYLFPYQKQDVARLALKPFNYLGYLQGLGKTDTTYALATILGMKKVLIVCLSSLIDTWVEIADRIGLTYKVIVGPDDLKGIKATDETIFYIVSYEKMTSYSTTYKPGQCGKCGKEFTGKECPVCKWKASRKWLDEHSEKSKQLYKYMKRITWSMVAVDESQCIKAKSSLRARAVRSLKCRRKLLITGTIIKGWISDSFFQLHWAFAGGSPLFSYNGWKGGTREFLRDFATYEYVSNQWADTVTSGRKKMVPEVKNVEVFWNMMQPKMIRRRAEHPEVAEHINLPEIKQYKVWADMEPEQKEFYEWWLNNFSVWFNSRLEEEERDSNRKLTGAEILAQLWKLRFAATVPSSSKVNNEMIQYNGNSTAKAKQVVDIVKECIVRNEKVIVYTGLNDMADELLAKFEKYGAEKVIGSVSIQKRNKIRRRFAKSKDLNILVAGIMAMGKGVTMTAANNVIFTDLDWTPDSIEQAWKRVHRISQTKDVNVYFVLSRESIDEDIDQLIFDKQAAISKAIDRTDFDDKTESFSPREFAMKMLDRRGMLVTA